MSYRDRASLSSFAGRSSLSSPGLRGSPGTGFVGGGRSPGPGGGGGIHLTIQHLQDEQERVQKKTFTNWINTHLVQHVPPSRVEDLFEDFKDGIKLLHLLEVLSSEKLPTEKGPRLKRLHFISNVTTALNFLGTKKIKLVNINASDVVDGKPSIVLGLIWTIILYFQIEENTKSLEEQAVSTPTSSTGSLTDPPPAKKKPGAALARFKGGAKKAMLLWAQKSVTKRFGIEVTNFGTSWRNGYAFSAIIHNIRPELVDMEVLPTRTNRVNLECAFNTAEEHLGIPRLLDAEDVDVDKPDEKSIMTYVAQFLKAYPDPEAEDADSKLSPEEREAKKKKVPTATLR